VEKLLVHICCGVDAVYSLRKLKETFPDVHIEGYFYDPNIHPEEEYLLRWVETERVCNQLGIPCHLAEYNLDRWLKATKGLENEPERGSRCAVCHDLRLEETAKFGKERGFDAFTTVLTASPKKDFQILKQVGEAVGKKYGIQFVAVDFKKGGGVEKMNKLSKESQLYHQNYCGCMYALFQQRGGEFVPELVSFGKGRPAGSREELLFTKRIRLYAEGLGLPCVEEEFSFVGWRLISSVLMVNKQPIPHTVLYFSKGIRGRLNGKIQKIEDKGDYIQLVLNKQNVKVWLFDQLKEIPLKEPRVFTDPIFITEKGYIPLDRETKIQAELKVSFDENTKSQNLLIGNLDAEYTLKFHSDTLLDGSGGYQLNDILSVIEKNKEKIKSGKLNIKVLGAYLIGKLGERV